MCSTLKDRRWNVNNTRVFKIVFRYLFQPYRTLHGRRWNSENSTRFQTSGVSCRVTLIREEFILTVPGWRKNLISRAKSLCGKICNLWRPPPGKSEKKVSYPLADYGRWENTINVYIIQVTSHDRMAGRLCEYKQLLRRVCCNVSVEIFSF